MAKRNTCIKSVVVKRKPVSLAIGEVVHVCQMFGNRSFVVTGEVDNTGGLNKLPVKCFAADHDFYIGRHDFIFLGDLGVPGYAYDDRPCSLFSSKMAAVAHGDSYEKWLSTSHYSNIDDYDDWSYRYH